MARKAPEMDSKQREALARAKARRADPREFPKMLYRAEREMLVVADPAEQKECEAEGWRETRAAAERAREEG
jgi:hypothetical protein